MITNNRRNSAQVQRITMDNIMNENNYKHLNNIAQVNKLSMRLIKTKQFFSQLKSTYVCRQA